MRKYFFLVLGCLFTYFVQAQTNNRVLISQAEYEQLKRDGGLINGIHYVIDPASVPPSNSSSLPVSPPHSLASTSACACYIAPDASYSIVPFQFASPPYYENDDGSTANIPIPFTFCLYGNNYTSLWINNNGNVTFDGPYTTFSAVAFPSALYTMVAPFWGDVDTRGAGSDYVYYKITPTAVYVNWVNVGYYSFHTDLLNTFQLIITDGNDPVIGVGNNVAFCYQDMQWTTGDASMGSGGFGGIPATVGCNKGDGVDFVQFGRFDSPGTAYFGPYATNNGVSWLDNQSFIFNACNSTNIAPTMAVGSICDTIEMCIGDTLVDTLIFLSPEAGQTTTLSASSASPDFSILNITNGNSASLVYQVIGNSIGLLNVNVNAVDDGTPVQNVNFNIVIQVNPNNTPQPTIYGDTIICPGENTILTATGGAYDSYLWNVGGSDSTLTINTGGTYQVEVSLNGCRKWDDITVFAFPDPSPLVSGDTTICGGDSTLLTVTNGPFVSYTWNTGSTVATTYANSPGTYSVTVTDGNGCSGSETINVSEVAPVITITSPPAVCGGDSVLMTASPSAGFTSILWNDGTLGAANYASSPGQYIVVGTDPGGCEARDTVDISLLPDPSGNIVMPVTCENQLTTFNYNNTGIPVTDYFWNFGTGNPGDTSNVQNPSFTYLNSGVTLITLIITGNNGCVDTLTLIDVVHTQPVGLINEAPICLDEVATFNPSISGDSIISFNWSFVGGNPGSSTDSTPTVNYLIPGTYPVQLTLTTEFGCTTIVNTNMVVRENPSSAFGVYPICPNRFTFDYIPGVNDSALVLDWDMGDGTLFNNVDTSIFNYVYGTPGTYNVQLVVENAYGCSDSIIVPVVVPDNVDITMPDVLRQGSSVGNDKVDFEVFEPGFNLCIEYTYTIYDRWGIKVFETHNDPYNPDMTCVDCFRGRTQNGNLLSPGVYYYILQGNFNVEKAGFITIFE